MNDAVEDLLNGLAGRSGLLDAAMRITATDLILLVGVILLVLWFWPSATRAANQRLVAAAAVGALAALALGSLVGALHPEARPFVSDGSTRLLIAHAPDNGLPSDHALVSFAVAGTLLWWRPALGRLLVLTATMIGVARVFVGVHWPSEIVVGAAIGLLAGAIAARSVPWWSWPQRWGSRFLPSPIVDRP